MILHDWNLEKKKVLIRKAYDALPTGGAFVVIEALIDDARRENAFGLLMSLNMLIEFGDAFDYSRRRFRQLVPRGWLPRIRSDPASGPSSAAVAYKWGAARKSAHPQRSHVHSYGVTGENIARQTGHRSTQMVQRYVREAELFVKNPLKQMG